MVFWVKFLAMKRSSISKDVIVNNEYNREIDWELRPGGMLVQKRDAGDGSSRAMIKIKVSYGSYHHDLTVPAQSTFGKILVFLSSGFVILSLFHFVVVMLSEMFLSY